MLFAPAQVMQWLEISEETLRHWRKRLAPIRGLNGYAPCFTHGDVLALAIVKCLVKEFDVRVGALEVIACSLFEECRRINWMRPERRFFLINPKASEFQVCDGLNGISLDRVRLIVPVDVLIDELRQRILSAPSNELQQELKLPLVSIGRKALA